MFRPTREPTVALPFGVRSIGHCRAKSGWWNIPWEKAFVQLFWTVEGEGVLFDGEKPFPLPAGQTFCYFPGARHRFGTDASPWFYRFITLDGPLCAEVVAAFGVTSRPRHSGPCPEPRFTRLAEDLVDVTPFGQRRAAAEAFELLALACGATPAASGDDVLVERCVETIGQRFDDPAFNIAALAETVGVNRCRLSRLFRERKRISPIEYLVARRLQKGLSLLRESSLPISDIAARCGYADPDYFSKSVRAVTGLSPRRFRGS